ncbi:MAG: tryptophan 7-halogenase [Balneolaceae bacterium]|nr:tryptophan 7-halogenase [Balneolaceae bacterium]
MSNIVTREHKHNSEIWSCDIMIAGAGFAGSLSALALKQSGFEVCLVEKKSHPRFTIGESSTPIADMILRDLSVKYSLHWLKPLSRYGTWQEQYPEIQCGIKRGFSYYKHNPGQSFSTDQSHNNELLVAASASDERSDTNWFRADVDSFLVKKVREYGIPYFENTEITGCILDEKLTFSVQSSESISKIKADFYIDATGGSNLIASLFNVNASHDSLLTNSRAIYSHFDGLETWSDQLEKLNISRSDYPYNPDNSALHHLIDEGWIWMLRFKTGRTSVGLMLDQNKNKGNEDKTAEEEWRSIIGKYPSLWELFELASLSDEPGSLVKTGRLQRSLIRAAGDRWVALPHSAGFVDPLHSTGIAHTLTGIEKVIEILVANWKNKSRLQKKVQRYSYGVLEELRFIDKLVDGCYKVMPHFRLFNTWSILYFTAAIWYEQRRLKGDRPTHFLSAGNEELRAIVDQSYQELKDMNLTDPSAQEITAFRECVRQRIEPYNIAGLLDPKARNMYRHTVAEL